MPKKIEELEWDKDPVRFTIDLDNPNIPAADVDVIGIIEHGGLIVSVVDHPEVPNLFISFDRLTQIAQNWRPVP